MRLVPMQTKAELLSVFPVPFASYQDIADEITQEKGLYCLVCSNPTLLAFFLRFSNLVNLICVLLHFGRFLLFLRLEKYCKIGNTFLPDRVQQASEKNLQFGGDFRNCEFMFDHPRLGIYCASFVFKAVLLQPDQPFHSFKASKAGDCDFHVVQERCAMDFEAPKLRKGWSAFAGVFLELRIWSQICTSCNTAPVCRITSSILAYQLCTFHMQKNMALLQKQTIYREVHQHRVLLPFPTFF